MKRILLMPTIVLAIFLYSCGGNKSDNPIPSNPTTPVGPVPLAITDFNPKSAMVGATVVITGTSFGSDVSAVSIKFGTSATVAPKTVTATSISVIVPNDAKTGKIQVTVGNETVTSSADFTLTTAASPTPTITSFAPSSASIGETITLNGTNFGTDTNFVSVKFGSAAGIKPKIVNGTTMTVIIPPLAISGKIQITVNGGTPVTSSIDFSLKPTWTITRVGMVMAGGSMFTDANLVLSGIDLSNDNQGEFKTNSKGSGVTKWVHTSSAILTKYTAYTYMAVFPNAPTSTSTIANLADTSDAVNKPFLKTTVITDQASKKETIYYVFIQGRDCSVAVISTAVIVNSIDAAKFASIGVSSNQNILISQP